MTKAWIFIVRFVGVATILAAITGISFIFVAFFSLLGEAELDKYEHFHVAFYTMISICMIFYLLLLWFGYSFIKLNIKYWYIYALLFVIEYLYFHTVKTLWMLEDPSWSISIAAATGVSNVGLVIQALSGIFIWGPFLIFLAWIINRKHNSANKSLQPTAESGG